MSTLIPTIASKMRLSSGICQFSSSSSLVGTSSVSHILQAIATQRKLPAAISSIALLKRDTCNQILLILVRKRYMVLVIKHLSMSPRNQVKFIFAKFKQIRHYTTKNCYLTRNYHLIKPYLHPAGPHYRSHLCNLCNKQVLFLQHLSSAHELQNLTVKIKKTKKT